MARKHQISSVEADDEPDDLVSRSDLKRANRVLEETLERLSNDLCKLSEKRLALLELSETVHEAVLRTQSIESPRARNRQLRLVRSALRETDWSAIQARLLSLLEHGTLPARTGNDADVGDGSEEKFAIGWVARLVADGFASLDAFVGEFPQADRAHLGQLIRVVRRSSGERRLKAERKLRDAVRGFQPRTPS